MSSNAKVANLRPTLIKRDGPPAKFQEARKCTDCMKSFGTFTDKKKFCFYCQQAFCNVCLTLISRNVYANDDSTPFEREVKSCLKCKIISAPDSERANLKELSIVDLKNFLIGINIRQEFASKDEMIDFILDIIKRAPTSSYQPRPSMSYLDRTISNARRQREERNAQEQTAIPTVTLLLRSTRAGPVPSAPPAAPEPAAQTSQAQQPGQKECSVCLDQQANCMFLNCGHLATCMDCGRRLESCPICRQRIVSFHQAYF